jgi:hypothetical protein
MSKIEDNAKKTLKEISDIITVGGKANDILKHVTRLVGAPVRTAVDSSACTIRRLPREVLVNAASTAIKINRLNAPATAPQSGVDVDISTPLRVAVVTTKYWGPKPRRLTVSFLDSPPQNLRERILSHMNAWSDRCGISFAWTQDVGAVRIAREIDGYWSYLGTDILHIAKDQPTMNLQEFTMQTDESEYKRVVRHETSHARNAARAYAQGAGSAHRQAKSLQVFLGARRLGQENRRCASANAAGRQDDLRHTRR